MENNIQEDMKTYVFCDTYAKIEQGLDGGKLMSISDYRTKEEFLEACREIHSDEENPKFKFSDARGPFSDLIKGDYIYEYIFSYYTDFKPSELKALSYYVSDSSWCYGLRNYDVSRESFFKAYMGKYDDIDEFIFKHLGADYETFPKHLLPFLYFEELIYELFNSNPAVGSYLYRDGHIFKNVY